MAAKSIFISATKQHVGKSTTSMGVLSGMFRSGVRPSNVGFMKPVGQQHVTLDDGTCVDKDCVLTKEFYNLGCNYADMSPVIIPSGYTKQYLDGKIDERGQVTSIQDAWARMSKDCESIVVEGTGHTGVGSIVDLNNARVASILGLDMVLICTGGLGSAFDELALNLYTCQHFGVRVRGVIVNKVQPAKTAMIRDYFGKALDKVSIPLLGVVPLDALVSAPSMMDLSERLFEAPLIAGHENRLRHCQDHLLVTTGVERFLERLHSGDYNQRLLVIHASREDIVQAFVQWYEEQQGAFEGGIVLTGRKAPAPSTVALIHRTDVPTILAPVITRKAMQMIQGFTAKLNTTDQQRTAAAVALIEEHVDLDRLWVT